MKKIRRKVLINFMYAWENYLASTNLTLFCAPFPSINGKQFYFCNSARAIGVHTGEFDSTGRSGTLAPRARAEDNAE
jgi:hypothetical protein